MEGYKKYGAFTILAWRTWQKRYQDFIERFTISADLENTLLDLCSDDSHLCSHCGNEMDEYKGIYVCYNCAYGDVY